MRLGDGRSAGVQLAGAAHQSLQGKGEYHIKVPINRPPDDRADGAESRVDLEAQSDRRVGSPPPTGPQRARRRDSHPLALRAPR
eukprot:1115492-Prorocentrum_minimum.AAC.5